MNSRRRIAALAVSMVASDIAQAQLASPPVPPALRVTANLAQPSTGSGALLSNNLLLNGDFENHTGSGCQYNLPSAAVGSVVLNTTGFGAANEIDVMSGACYGPLAVSGTTKLGLHTRPDGSEDSFSFDLSLPVSAGASYTLTYWALADVTFDPALAQVTVGLSSNAYAFGTLLHTGVLTTTGTWTQFTHNFVAPTGATYLTVSSGPITMAWAHVDDFCLAEGCSSGTSYCTSGTTSNGCVPVLSASGLPSASASSGYTLTCVGVEGQKSGLVFYGASGAVSVPWGTGGTSFLCVKAPLQRTPTHNSGGNLNTCTGQLSLDFLAFMAGDPSALGQPLTAGQAYRAQTWFRDPLAVKTTNLSNGWAFVVCP